MKNLENFGVQELNNLELHTIEGGNWLTDAADAISDAADAVIEAVGDAVDAVEGFWDGLTGN